jgi:prephenate dehydratase
MDLFPLAEKIPFTREGLVSACEAGLVDLACLPVTTSIVGVTPYMDTALSINNVKIVAEYPKMLGYSLVVKRGTKLRDINEVFAHPVAFEEVQPWLDRELPHVKRVEVATGGRAAMMVAESDFADKASFGPKAGAEIYELDTLLDDIEEGPHNVTRWWVLGRLASAPTGNDKTSFLMDLGDAELTDTLMAMFEAGLRVLTIYERPAKSSLDRHRYLIEIEGHQTDKPLAEFLTNFPVTKVLGSYPRRY